MSIPPRFLDELRNRVTLSEIIGRKVRLTHAGREYKGCCPFHKEKSPSFTVNDDKQFYHCFGCGAHGSVIDFVMNHDNLSFIEAVEQLAQEAGLQVPKSSPQDVEKAQKSRSLHALLEEATRWMEEQLRLPEHRTAYQYITGRGLSEDLLACYRIGFAPADRQVLRRAMKERGFTDSQMIEAGILRAEGKNGEPYAFFRDRIMFPVPDRRGRVVAFGGRILPDHLRAPDKGDYVPAKYMNSSDTPLFHKGSMLYGEPHARQAAIDGQPIIVVEGYLDVMACAKAGFKGAVAPLGTALTEEQIAVLWKMIPGEERVPVLCFDGDNAGRRAAARAVERILPMLQSGNSARIAFLPDGQDPDSLVNSHGAKALQTVLDNALPLHEFLWFHHTSGRKFETPESRAALNKALEAEISRIPDRDVQYYYQQAMREKTRKAFGSSYTGSSGKFGKSKSASEKLALNRPVFPKRMVLDTVLLACMVHHPDILADVEEEAGSLELADKRLDRIRVSVLSTFAHNPELDSGGLKNHLIAFGFEEDLKGLSSVSLYTHAAFVRPKTDRERVLQGWKITLAMLSRMQEEEELRLAASGLAENMSSENESKIMAIRKGAKDAPY